VVLLRKSIPQSCNLNFAVYRGVVEPIHWIRITAEWKSIRPVSACKRLCVGMGADNGTRHFKLKVRKAGARMWRRRGPLHPNEVLKPAPWGWRHGRRVAHARPHLHRLARLLRADQGVNVGVRRLLLGVFLQGL
jgi:hypothetical protein